MSSVVPQGRRVVFFGGSFDPPHCGHIAIARAAQQAVATPSHVQEQEQPQVLFAPVGLQPFKPAGSTACFEDRVAMTRLAIDGHPGFELSLADAPDAAATRPNYTSETLRKLRPQFPPDTEWFMLLGADSFRTLHHWQNAAELPFLATLIVAARPGEDISDLPALLPESVTLSSPLQQADPLPPAPAPRPKRFHLQNPAGLHAELLLLPSLNYDISATLLRNQIHHPSADSKRLLPQPVLDYIHLKNLYK